MGKFAWFSLAILRKKFWHMEIQRNERNSDHSDRGASNRVLLPFSIEAILSAPHRQSPLSSLEKFTRSNLSEDISTTENAERGIMKSSCYFKGYQGNS